MAARFVSTVAILVVAISTSESSASRTSCDYTSAAPEFKAACSYKMWTQFESSMVLSNITVLDLSNNIITNLGRGIFSKLSNLNVVSMQNNVISKVDKQAFIDSIHIRVIDLSHNKITYIAPETFKENLNLTMLYLKNNKLILPTLGPFLISNSLNILNIDYNRISGLVTRNTFNGLPHLQILYMEGNSITGFSTQSFTEVLNLTEVHVGDIYNSSCENIRAVRQLVGRLGNVVKIDTDTQRHLRRSPTGNQLITIQEHGALHCSTFGDKVAVVSACLGAMFVCALSLICIVLVVIKEKLRRKKRRERYDSYELETHFQNQQVTNPTSEPILVPDRVADSVQDPMHDGYERPAPQDPVKSLPVAPDRPNLTFLYGYMQVLSDIDEVSVAAAVSRGHQPTSVVDVTPPEATSTWRQTRMTSCVRSGQFQDPGAGRAVRPRPYPTRLLPDVPDTSCNYEPVNFQSEKNAFRSVDCIYPYATSSSGVCVQYQEDNTVSNYEKLIEAKMSQIIAEEAADFSEFAQSRLSSGRAVKAAQEFKQ